MGGFASVFDGSCFGASDFCIHALTSEINPTNIQELLLARRDNPEEYAKAEAKLKIIHEKYGPNGYNYALGNGMFDLNNYERDEEQRKGNGFETGRTEKVVDALRRLVENTDPKLLEKPAVKDEITEHFKMLSSRRLAQLRGLPEKTPFLKRKAEALWSGNLNNELLGLV